VNRDRHCPLARKVPINVTVPQNDSVIALGDYKRGGLWLRSTMTLAADSLPNDIVTLKAMLLSERAAREAAELKARGSARRLAGWSGSRARTSASHVRGSTSLSFAVSIRV
jgi:hypothetical protein